MSVKKSIYKTAESVSPGHPDKLCDQISDAILDAYLAEDADARVAVETVGGHGKVFITGEVTSSAKVDVAPIVERLAPGVELETRIVAQSPEIAHGVDTGGAGDQGIMVGYASSETDELLPLEVVLSRRLNQALYERLPHDGKTQVTVRDGVIQSIVASFQNAPQPELESAVKYWLSSSSTITYDLSTINLHINPAGDWHQGGFDADAGLTGRKLVVDNYGPSVPIGGGCFSGKDPSKVDRSAAYMARKIAVDYLRERKAQEVFVHLAYAIGYNQPLEATVTIDGAQEVVEGYDLTPAGIIKSLDLKRPIYEQTARFGHFGHPNFPWEK
ncbi:MAG: methionine adenosyltransferase domain-containing protein [Candidatus Saccharibacteria bacterium]|nr:methionine adenosyltransferase domain-containing protein [Candidatus Saccharibacteria bacterium]